LRRVSIIPGSRHVTPTGLYLWVDDTGEPYVSRGDGLERRRAHEWAGTRTGEFLFLRLMDLEKWLLRRRDEQGARAAERARNELDDHFKAQAARDSSWLRGLGYAGR